MYWAGSVCMAKASTTRKILTRKASMDTPQVYTIGPGQQGPGRLVARRCTNTTHLTAATHKQVQRRVDPILPSLAAVKRRLAVNPALERAPPPGPRLPVGRRDRPAAKDACHAWP